MVSARAWTAVGLGVLLALAMTVISCFTVTFKNGTLKCNPDDMGRQCPVGATCVQGFCYQTPDLFGSGLPGDAGIILDAGDAAPPPTD